MNSLVINIFFVLFYLRTLVSVTANDAELGISSCRYFGGTDPDGDRCRKDAVKIKKLPDECSSLLYDGVTCFNSFEINPSTPDASTDRISDVLDSGKSVFLYYGHENTLEWFNAVDPDRTATEVGKVQEFLKGHSVSGLVLKEISYSGILKLGYDFPPGFSEKLKVYVNSMKAGNADLKIGLYIQATDLMICGGNSNKWIDFSIINDVMDYYIIGFDNFNECGTNLLNGGIIPMDSTDPNINTLNKFTGALNKTSIPKDKLYFEFLVNPSVSQADVPKYFPCEVSYNEFCENPDYKYHWCADNVESLFQKGAFAKNYGHGFVAKSIDLVDRDNKCECGDDQYITFHMILNGFSGLEKKTCDKINGS